VAYANGTLLVPEYPRWAPEVESAALDAYRRLLPDWTIAKINAVPVLRMGGSIHCVTMNLAGLGTRQRKGSDVQNSILPGRRSTK
jgi:agmatine/peptidylarginine deiminase